MERPTLPRPDPARGLAAYRAASASLASVASTLEPADWHQSSACDGWSVLDLVGHVVCVARWHHLWLDRAEAGETTAPFPPSVLAEHNAAALRSLDIEDGPDRAAMFVELSGTYASRVAARWDLAYAYPGGLISAGLHAVLAAGEWHLHAWDLSRGIGREYDADAELIREAWLALGRQVASTGDAFHALLVSSGRTAH